jgi:hypothetical protein
MKPHSAIRPLLLVLLVSVPLAACSSTRMVEGDGPYRFAALNAQGVRHTAVISLVDGRQERARALRMAPDSTSWIDPATRSERMVATAEGLPSGSPTGAEGRYWEGPRPWRWAPGPASP